MSKLHVKKGDVVKIIAGKDKGNVGEIIAVDPDSGRLVVDGYNKIIKHNKPRGAQDPGGKKTESGSIDASNVMIVCPSCNSATRIAKKIEGDKKTRVCKKCGASLDTKKKASAKKAATAKKSKKDKDAPVEEVKAEKKAVKKDTAKKETAKKETTKKTTAKLDKADK